MDETYEEAIARDRELSDRVAAKRRAGAVGPMAFLPVRRAAELLHVAPSTVQRRRAREEHRPRRALDSPERAERDLIILTLRVAGVSIRAIAAEVGCSVGTVHRAIALHPGALRLLGEADSRP